MKKAKKKIKEMPIGAMHEDFEGVEALPANGKEVTMESEIPEIPHAEAGALQAVKEAVKGHGEQTVLPDDCQFGDNDLCYVEA